MNNISLVILVLFIIYVVVSIILSLIVYVENDNSKIKNNAIDNDMHTIQK